MNRLWVRFSLVIGGVLLFVMTAPFLLRFLIYPLTGSLYTNLRQAIREAVGAIPEETLIQLRDAAMADATLGLTIIVVIGSTAALGVGVWLSRSLTAPLQQLEEAAQAIKVQDFSRRVEVQGSQELVAVTTAFNEMAAQLEEAETLRRNLLSDTAHELRHPVHVLQGNLQAILDDVYPLTKEEIARLVDQTRHLSTLVQDLYDLAQAEAHQLPLQRQETDVAALVKDTAVAFKPMAAAKKVELRVELLGTLPTANVDASRIRQTVNNLMSNALRHTSTGDVITVAVEEMPDHVEVRVHDTGAGITAEQLPYVYERFYRTDSARSRETGGSGLGLAIVKATIEAHDGSVAVTSPGPGQGSTFILSLPRTD